MSYISHLQGAGPSATVSPSFSSFPSFESSYPRLASGNSLPSTETPTLWRPDEGCTSVATSTDCDGFPGCIWLSDPYQMCKLYKPWPTDPSRGCIDQLSEDNCINFSMCVWNDEIEECEEAGASEAPSVAPSATPSGVPTETNTFWPTGEPSLASTVGPSEPGTESTFDPKVESQKEPSVLLVYFVFFGGATLAVVYYSFVLCRKRQRSLSNMHASFGNSRTRFDPLEELEIPRFEMSSPTLART